MDTLAHALWALAVAKFANFKLNSNDKSKKNAKKETKKSKTRLNIWLSAFFGVAPDLFSFGLWFVFMIFSVLFGKGVAGEFHNSWNGTSSAVVLVKSIVGNLYDLTHSLLIFLVVFGLVYLWKKRFVFEMLGWPLHILIDIPTHSFKFYPTPFLWPISNWKFDGINWGQPWFMITNYSLLAITYFVILYLGWKETKKKINSKKKK